MSKAGILKAVGEAISGARKSRALKKIKRSPARISENIKNTKDADEAALIADKAISSAGRRGAVKGAVGTAAAYGLYQLGKNYNVSVTKKGSTSSSSTNKSANSVSAARKEQVSANKAKVKAAGQQANAKTNKEKVAANAAKVAANKKMVAANKKKVEANKARYKKG